MIDKRAFSEAARDSDALAGEHGIEECLRRMDIDEEAIHWCIQQRALRAAMIHDGLDPRLMPMDRPTPVNLSSDAESLLPLLQAAVLDGIVLGMLVRGRDFGIGRKTR